MRALAKSKSNINETQIRIVYEPRMSPKYGWCVTYHKVIARPMMCSLSAAPHHKNIWCVWSGDGGAGAGWSGWSGVERGVERGVEGGWGGRVRELGGVKWGVG